MLDKILHDSQERIPRYAPVSFAPLPGGAPARRASPPDFCRKSGRFPAFSSLALEMSNFIFMHFLSHHHFFSSTCTKSVVFVSEMSLTRFSPRGTL